MENLQSNHLRLWLDGTNVDGSGNANLAHGNVVSRWFDMSGHGNSLSLSAAGFYPTFYASDDRAIWHASKLKDSIQAANKLMGVVHFSGKQFLFSDPRQTTPPLLSGEKEYTIIAVWRAIDMTRDTRRPP
jgi:hypothetical protein